MQVEKAPIAHTDESFLLALYSTTRQDELVIVPWNDEQKHAFLQMQFQAQHLHYTTKFPDASFQLLSLNNQSIGRLYTAEFDEEIRILDLTLMPEFRNRKIGTNLLNEILHEAEIKNKSVQIYLENYNPAQTLFARLGFEIVAEEGLYQLWCRSAKQINSEKVTTKNGVANSQAGS